MQQAYTENGWLKQWSHDVTVRRPHFCFGCEREIRTGEVAERHDVLEAEGWSHSYLCSECVGFLHSHSGYFEDGYGQGDIAEARRQVGRASRL